MVEKEIHQLSANKQNSNNTSTAKKWQLNEKKTPETQTMNFVSILFRLSHLFAKKCHELIHSVQNGKILLTINNITTVVFDVAFE